jgi:hypothetical protein
MDHLWQVLLRAADDSGPLSCEDCVVLLDYMADLLTSGYPQKEILALAERYLRRCPDCRTELRAALDDLALLQVEKV